MKRDLQELPKIRDSLSYLYIEHCKVEQDGKSIACFDIHGKTKIPCASLSLLMLGPGTAITHEAIKTIADTGCSLLWCGEEGVRLYAQGLGETRKATRLIHQASMVSDPEKRLEVVKRMYRMRFKEDTLKDNVTLEQLRGMEGVRVRAAYYRASKEHNVVWQGRSYKRQHWAGTDPVNRALSSANSCLYGICHAAIVSVGYSPGLGFIHHGKQLSFVYDIADLYKVELTIPIAFHAAAQEMERIDQRVRIEMRDRFRELRLLKRIIPDMDYVVSFDESEEKETLNYDEDPALPSPLWDGDSNG